jgi:PAS domain S-box-containing protein
MMMGNGGVKTNFLNGIELLDAMSDAISVQDAELRVIYQNRAHKQLMGDHLGEYCYAAYQKKEAACEGCHLLQSFRDGLPHSREATTSTERGVRHVEISSSPLRNADGVIVAGIESVRDITGRRELEERLRLQQAAMETSREGIAIYGADSSGFRHVNQSMARLFGYAGAEELLNRSWHILYPPDEVARLEKDAMTRLRRDGTWQGEATGKRKDGSMFSLDISASMIDAGNIVVIYRDISERKKAESLLKESEERFRKIIEQSPISMALVSMDGTIDYINTCAVETFGYQLEDIPTMDAWWHLAYPEAAYREEVITRWMGLVQRALVENRYIERREYRVTCKDGSLKTMLIFGVVISGKVLAMFEDITERKQAEELLTANEERLRVIFDTIQAGIVLVSPAGTISFANQRMADMFGCSLAELIGTSYPEHIHPDQRHVGDERMRALIAGEVDHVYSERHYLCRDGGDFWGHLSGRRLEDGEGNLVSLVGVIADITDLKKVQRVLQESETRYRRFSTMTSDFLSTCRRWGDTPFRIEWLAGSFEAITGYAKEQILEWGCWLTLVHPDDKGRVGQRLMDLRPGDTTSDEFRMIRKDGEIRWIHEVSRCEAGESAGEQLLYGTCQDITKRKEAEEAIQNLNRHLERLVQERTMDLERSNEELATFCYAVSHELRAPIARLEGFSALLGETCTGTDETSFLAARIVAASAQLQSVVDAILQLSRLSRMELSLQPVDLSELVRRKLDLLLAEHPDRRLEAVLSAGVTVVADPSQMEICMANLIGNAFKYTGQTVGARIEFGVTGEAGKEVYFVRDNGAGFDMAYAEKLYTPFQRLHLQEDFPGIGIGLATVKRIIEQHGGEIWAESRVGEGATFFFTLGSEGGAGR